VHARSRRDARVAHRLIGDREVDEHVRAVQHRLQRRAQRRVGAAGELHVLGALDRGARRRPHAPRGAGDGHADHAAT
jgi:hypothetical protein